MDGGTIGSFARDRGASAAATRSLNPASPLQLAANGVWAALVSVAAALLLFVGSHDGSATGGRWTAALLWIALWGGMVVLRSPRTGLDPIAIGIAVAGIPAVLLAPAADELTFSIAAAALWLALLGGWLARERTLVLAGDRVAARSWLAGVLRRPVDWQRARDLRFVTHRGCLEMTAPDGRTLAFAWRPRRHAGVVAALVAAGAAVTDAE